MPIYEFLCTVCGGSQETLIRNTGDTPLCESCGGENMKRKLSVFAVSSSSSEPECACASGAGVSRNIPSRGCGCR